MIVDDLNMYDEFTDKFRLTKDLMTFEDFEYLYVTLKYDLKVNDTGSQLYIDDGLILDYHYDIVDGIRVMYLSANVRSKYPSRVHLEYLLTYVLNYDADMFVFDSKNCPIKNIKVNGYEAGNDLYFFYRDIYNNYEYKEAKRLLLHR